MAIFARHPSSREITRVNAIEYRDERDKGIAQVGFSVVGVVALVVSAIEFVAVAVLADARDRPPSARLVAGIRDRLRGPRHVLLKSTDGFSRLGPTLGVLAAHALSLASFANTVEDIPVGVAYALWSGIGTVAIAVAFSGKEITAVKVLGVQLVVSGAVVLNLDGGH
ncbi:DMT family transporter [Blastococcus aggregatus]|nr:multidrug efflux SMR transporter [Blastococcus aggregatus]